MTKYFVDVNGNYLGGFDNADAPIGSIEVLIPPNHSLDIWNGKEWLPYKNVPVIVSMRQARLALLQSKLLETVSQAIANGNEADKITWEYATEVNRSDSLVKNLSVSLGLTEQDLDNLFLLASSL